MSFLDQLEVFVRVAEMSSFTQAADGLGLPKASVSTAVAQLENRLGVRLLHRTTRKVSLTHDGSAFYERCKGALSEIDELQTMFKSQTSGALRGRVRIDMSTVIARNVVVPRLSEILALYPHLEIEISSTERRVDLIREGFDCVVRAGSVNDSGLIARAIGRMPVVNCVSPSYIERYGKPNSIEDLSEHYLVHYAATLGAKPTGFEYWLENEISAVAMEGAVTVNNAEAYQAACLAGLGIIQAPMAGVYDLIEQGRLVEVLPRWRAAPMQFSLVYASRRNLSARVRVVMDWVYTVLAESFQKQSRNAVLI